METLGGMMHKMGKFNLAFVAILVFSGGCALNRPTKPVLEDGRRTLKTSLQGTYSFLKTLTDVKYPGKSHRGLARGFHLVADQLVQFRITETRLEIASVDPRYSNESTAEITNVLASFPIRHVDVLKKQNADGEDTHEEEVTESRRPWNQRDYIVVDLTQDAQDEFAGQVAKSAASSELRMDQAKGTVQFDVSRMLEDDTQVTERYSFIRFQPSSTYVQREYPKSIQSRFGFFKTTTYQFDKYGRALQADLREFINRWDTSKQIVYYLSENFPEHLKPVARQVFASWNESFTAAVGRPVLELRENSGQQLGDLSVNMIVYDESTHNQHGILGYGPSVTNPRTGEILKADVILYGSILKGALYRNRVWGQLLGDPRLGKMAQGSFDLFNTPLPTDVDMFQFAKEAVHGAELDEALKETLKDPKAIHQQIDSLREEMFHDHSHEITRLSEDTLSQVGAEGNDSLSDEEFEIEIFTPLLAHELGHNLGLRHNFMGSVDKVHFEGEKKSASIMDYGHMPSHEPAGPGAYDKAAIHVSYGNDTATHSSALAANFLFCTDESVMTSRNGLCLQHDAGTTLTELVENLRLRYSSSWVLNNLRMGQVHFSESSSEYSRKVLRHLVPIRSVFDHAVAIEQAAEKGEVSSLWMLLKQRIEADPGATNTLEASVTESFKVEVENKAIKVVSVNRQVVLDRDKVEAAIKDAKEAKQLVYKTLVKIIRDTARPDFSIEDEFNDELAIRGVLIDKLYSLLMIGSRFPNPLGNGTSINMLSTHGKEAHEFFTSILSGTAYAEDKNGKEMVQLARIDSNLREMALDILVKNLATTNVSPESIYLLTLEKRSYNGEDARKAAALASLVEAGERMKSKWDKLQNLEEFNGFLEELKAHNLVGLDGKLAEFSDYALAEEWHGKSRATLDGLFQPYALELAQIESQANSDLKKQITAEKIRAAIQANYKIVLRADTPKAVREEAKNQVAVLQKTRGKLRGVYTSLLNDQVLRAPVKQTAFGYETASGRLIRDNINHYEDMLAAIEAVREEEKLLLERANKDAVANSESIQVWDKHIEFLDEQIASINRYLANEKLFLKKLYDNFRDRE